MTAVNVFAATFVALVGVTVGKPPPASMVTSTGHHRMGFSSSCWTTNRETVCADYVAPHCGKGPGSAPVVRVRRGELVRFELGFTPRSVSVSVGGGTARPLASTRRPTWRAGRAGVLILFADAKTNGDASYVACVVFR